jgi:hypothetical protein
MERIQPEVWNLLPRGFKYLVISSAISIFWWWFTPLLGLGSVIAVFAISKYLRVALKELSKIDKRFKTCYNGIIVLFLGYVIAAGIYTYMYSIFLLPVGILLGLTLTAFRLYKIYRDWRFLAASIIYVPEAVASIFLILGVFSVVGHVLAYSALKSITKKLQTTTSENF